MKYKEIYQKIDLIYTGLNSLNENIQDRHFSVFNKGEAQFLNKKVKEIYKLKQEIEKLSIQNDTILQR